MGKRPNKFHSGASDGAAPADVCGAGGAGGGEATDLAQDVAKYAASLGLAGGGAAPASDFDDFAPEVAGKRLAGDKSRKGGKVEGKRKGKKGKRDGAGDDGVDGAFDEGEEEEEEEGPPGRPAAGKSKDAKGGGTGRDWNVGAGPRPGGWCLPGWCGCGGTVAVSLWWCTARR